MYIQTFPIVVICCVFTVGNPVVVATCSGSHTIAGTAIILVSVPR